MVDNGRALTVTELPFRILGTPERNGLLIVGDHASNHLPRGVDLGIQAEELDRHIAWDIGVADVAERIVANYRCAAFLGNVSRLVTDLNRYPVDADVVPLQSDGLFIPGNQLSGEERQARIERHFVPYHDSLSSLLQNQRPALQHQSPVQQHADTDEKQAEEHIVKGADVCFHLVLIFCF